MPELKLKDVSKRYGTTDAVRAVSFEISNGAFCAIVGPSGCGKSSLLRMIAGLEEISQGTVTINGRVVNNVDPADRGVSMVFQDYALYTHMTVEQNLGFGLKVANKSRGEISDRVHDTANALDLEELLGRRLRGLSGGEQQGVAVGRSIIRNRDIFLFDEPLSNLDADLRAKTRLEIARLHHDRGFTAVYVTSDQVEAMSLADRIVVMRDGRIEQIGSPLDLYENPDNQFVAGFFGAPALNFLPAIARESQPGAIRVSVDNNPGSKITIPMRYPTVEAGTKLTLGIRPEHMEPTHDALFSVVLNAQMTERLGGTSYIYTRGSGGEPVAIKQKGDCLVKAGDRLEFTFAPEKVRLFNEVGARLR